MVFTEAEDKHLEHVVSTFRGNGRELESAVGALYLGKIYGWRVLRVMHASISYRKYQKILQLDFKDWCPDTTPLTARHRGYQLALKAQNFWDLVRGTEAAPDGYKESKDQFA